jgi:CRP-like cAMP-binding protein
MGETVLTDLDKQLFRALLEQAIREGKFHVKFASSTPIKVTQTETSQDVAQQTRLDDTETVLPRPEGCLCSLCPNFENCDVGLTWSATRRRADITTYPVAQRSSDGRTADKVTIPVTRQADIEADVPVAWNPKEGTSPAMSQILELLRNYLEGLKASSIARETDLSRRHVYRVLKALRERGLIEKSGSRWVLVKTAQLEPDEGEEIG